MEKAQKTSFRQTPETGSILTPQDPKSAADLLSSLTSEEVEAFLDSLSHNALLSLPWLFEHWAHAHQKPPEGDWKTWVILGGRGAGKTRAGAEWVRAQVEGARPEDEGLARRVALVAETLDQARDVMIFGDSGLIECCPDDRKPEWQATKRQLVWPNGAVAQIFSASDPESLRGPQFDCAWADEFGCAAIDKGTNQPNVFVDAKSSEGFVPYHSSGARDDFIQYRYFQAHLNHWAKPENNPVSVHFNQPMVDMSRAYIWAFDTRPWPDFPARSEIWSDGENYGRGHWVSGRVGAATLAAVVTEIAERSNFSNVNVSNLHGSVRGYIVNGSQSARQSLQPLMLSHGFECSEIGGDVVFKSRLGSTPVGIDGEVLVSSQKSDAISYTRTPDLELSSQVQVNFYQAENAYQLGAASAVIPDQSEPSTTSLDVPIALSASEGSNVAARFLSEAHIARDEAMFSLPPSMLGITVGDIVRFGHAANNKLYRIDRLEETNARLCHAVRVEHGVYQKGGALERSPQEPTIMLPAPAYIEFLDIPLITGEEVAHAPHIAASGRPWVGQLSVYTSSSDSGYGLNTEIQAPSVVGTTLNGLPRRMPDRWSTSDSLRVRVPSGALESRNREEVLNGANIAALRGPNQTDWELLQFKNALLVGPGEFELSVFLRGQFGTDGVMSDLHPSGSDFVLIDGSTVQPTLSVSARGLARHYRIGPSTLGYDDPSFAHFTESFFGVGLRPYAPSHLNARLSENGDIRLNWIRRTRIDGDSWQGTDVPLGEDEETYLVRVRSGSTIVRQTTVAAPSFDYHFADIQSDAATAPFEFEVAQVSSQFGPGPFKRIVFDG